MRFYGIDGHDPLDAEDRADLTAITAATERGYRIAVQCHWLAAPSSVRRHRGPRCHAKAVAE